MWSDMVRLLILAFGPLWVSRAAVARAVAGHRLLGLVAGAGVVAWGNSIGRVVQAAIIELECLRIVHFGVTETPTHQCTAPQPREQLAWDPSVTDLIPVSPGHIEGRDSENMASRRRYGLARLQHLRWFAQRIRERKNA